MLCVFYSPCFRSGSVKKMKVDISRFTSSNFLKCSLILGSVVILQACDQHQVKPEQEDQQEAVEEEGVKVSAIGLLCLVVRKLIYAPKDGVLCQS